MYLKYKHELMSGHAVQAVYMSPKPNIYHPNAQQ